MSPLQVSTLARSLMQQHGLTFWKLKFDRAKKRAGYCHYRTQTISLSCYFIELNSDAEIQDTILHEIAHALAGHQHGHNDYWKDVCRKIGAKPERCYDSDQVQMPKGQFTATCPGCQRVFHKHRRPRTQRYCRKCGIDHGSLTFTNFKSQNMSIS